MGIEKAHTESSPSEPRYMDVRKRSEVVVVIIPGTREKVKRPEDLKSVIGPTAINSKMVTGGKHPQSICPSRQYYLFYQDRVQFIQFSVFGSEIFHQSGPPVFLGIRRSLGKRAEGRFKLNSYLTTTANTYASITSLHSRFLAIHLLSITPKDRVNALLLDAELGQRLFHKLVPISNGGLGVRLGG